MGVGTLEAYSSRAQTGDVVDPRHEKGNSAYDCDPASKGRPRVMVAHVSKDYCTYRSYRLGRRRFGWSLFVHPW